MNCSSNCKCLQYNAFWKNRVNAFDTSVKFFYSLGHEYYPEKKALLKS